MERIVPRRSSVPNSLRYNAVPDVCKVRILEVIEKVKHSLEPQLGSSI